MCVCVCVCVCVCACVCLSVCLAMYTITQKLMVQNSKHFKLEHNVEYVNSSDKLDSGHCLLKFKVTA